MTQTQDSNLPAKKPNGRAIHRQDSRRQIYLPFLGGVLIVAILILIVLLLQKRAQVALIADLMLIVMVLFPSFICLFLIMLGTVALVVLTHNLHSSAERPLVRLEKLSETMYEKGVNYADSINQGTIKWYSKLGPLMKILSFFDESPQEKTQEEKHESNTQ